MIRPYPKNLLYLVTLVFLCGSGRTPAMIGSLKGRVVNASADSAGIVGQEVSLQLFKPSFAEPKTVMVHRTSGDGRFAFRIVDLDTAAHYVACTDHQGVRYYSELAHFRATDTLIRDIVVYDSTQTNRPIQGLMHHLFVQNTGSSLAVRESRIFSNPSQKTILKAIADAHEAEAVMRIILPANARNIAPIGSRGEEDLKVHGHILYDIGVFEPGNRQISYAYEIPWQGPSATVEVDFPFTTRAFDIFIVDETVTPQAEGLIDHGPFTIRGSNYRRYGLQEVPGGQRLRIRFLRSSTMGHGSSDTVLLFITLGLLMMGWVAAAIWRRKKKLEWADAAREQLQANRTQLIEEIAALRADTDAEVAQKRQDLFDQLRQIEQMLHQGRAKGKH